MMNGETGIVRLGARARQNNGLKVGIVGCGYWGSKHARVFSSLGNVDQVALIDPDPKIREAMSSSFPKAAAFPDLDTALPHVDAVVIATPPRSHLDLVLTALRGGKHVLVEKPLATSAEEASRIVDEADKSDKIVMVGHTFEYNPAVQELRQRIVQKEIGDVYYIHSSRFNVDLYRSDVNVIWDLAPHDVSIFNCLFQSVPTKVTAWGSSAGHVDAAYIRLDYDEIGATGYIHISWLDPKKIRQVTVVGRDKVAVFNDMDSDDRLRIFERSVVTSEADDPESGWPPTYRYGDSVSLAVEPKEPLMAEGEHFVHCILNNRRPDSDAFSGLAVVATLEAAERSIRTGSPVKLELPNRTVNASYGNAVSFGGGA